jgi:hypothetical protein
MTAMVVGSNDVFPQVLAYAVGALQAVVVFVGHV